MTWRSVQYFIGDMRERLAGRLSAICCHHDDRIPEPGLVYDPKRYTSFDPVRFAEEFKLANSFLDRPEKLPSDFTTKVEVNNLSTADAQAALRGTGIEIAETIDINDAAAFETIEAKLVGVSPLDLLVTAEQVRPGDKVGLLVQNGVARGYVLLERGSGKLPFEPAKRSGVKIADADLAAADKLVRDTAGVASELEALATRRETLVTDIDGLRTDIEALTKLREETAGSLIEVRTQLTELAKVRETLTSAIATASNDLKVADESRKAITEATRNAQPVNVVLGNNSPDVMAKLAGEGITTIADVAKLTPAAIRRLDSAGVLKESEATALKTKAADFLKRPIG
jgi:predicted flap endonuclease-1-like 5' DNA nuclease